MQVSKFAFVVLDLVVQYTKPMCWLGSTSPQWNILCRVERKILT